MQRVSVLGSNLVLGDRHVVAAMSHVAITLSIRY